MFETFCLSVASVIIRMWLLWSYTEWCGELWQEQGAGCLADGLKAKILCSNTFAFMWSLSWSPWNNVQVPLMLQGKLQLQFAEWSYISAGQAEHTRWSISRYCEKQVLSVWVWMDRGKRWDQRTKENMNKVTWNWIYPDLVPFPKVREVRMAPGCQFDVTNMLKQLL